jgi:hypothetical protein
MKMSINKLTNLPGDSNKGSLKQLQPNEDTVSTNFCKFQFLNRDLSTIVASQRSRSCVPAAKNTVQ